jgi:hypothetical protein
MLYEAKLAQEFAAFIRGRYLCNWILSIQLYLKAKHVFEYKFRQDMIWSTLKAVAAFTKVGKELGVLKA